MVREHSNDRSHTPRGRSWVGVVLSLVLLIAIPSIATAQKAPEGMLQVSGSVEPDGSAIRLDWSGAKPPRTGNTIVSRRTLGETGIGSWQAIASDLGNASGYEDMSTEAGTAYEYQVERIAAKDGRTVDLGYWTGGIEAPMPEPGGRALLVLEDLAADRLAARIARFEMDLVGDGWEVIRIATPPGRPGNAVENLSRARALKAQIHDHFWDAPDKDHALILVGRVPLVKGGIVGPDGHDPVAHETDLFYADMVGEWADNGAGRLNAAQVVGGRIDMRVGRIDFSPLAANDRKVELDLLRAYFDRNHAWRQGLLGDLRQAYGGTKHLLGEVHALRNVVGAAAFTHGGHHDVGEQQPWLLGVDFGNWNGKKYLAEFSAKPVFAINFGSSKQKIGKAQNAMTALLALPWYPIAVGWGGRPTWRLHHMAMGHAMGYSHLRTVNNGLPWQRYRDSMEYRPTGQYLWRNPIWVNLLGDPTARPFPLLPPKALQAEADTGGVGLQWNAPGSGAITGFRVLRAEASLGPYEPLGDTARDQTQFRDPDGTPQHWYMVRSRGLQKVAAGSFHTLSQGSFTQVGRSAVVAPPLELSATPGKPVLLPDVESVPDAQLFPLFGTDAGELKVERKGWSLTRSEGATGEIGMFYGLSDGLSTDVGRLSIKVTSGGQ